MRVLPALATAALALTACAGSASSSGSETTVDVSVSQCGQGWTARTAGQQHLVLRNADSRPAEVQLIAPDTGKIYGDVEPLGPATTTSLDLALNPGRYALRCLLEDEPAVTGPTVTLTGDYRGGAPGVVPVTQGDLIAATQQYQQYVKARLPGLAQEVARLGRDLGTRATAEKDWLNAHLDYERLGAAYDAFGDLDAAINGRPDGLRDGVRDERWTGFHRIEYGLWRGESAASLAPQVRTLATDLATLRAQFASAQIDPLTLTIRAHEITENALQFSLTGKDDFGSHSELATVRANLDGTRAVLDILGARVPNRTALYAALARAEQAVAGGDHEHVDAAISELAELLAPVASQLEPRRTS